MLVAAGFFVGDIARAQENEAEAPQNGRAQSSLGLQPGDAVVTNFSGLKDSGFDAKEEEALAFAIDPNGASALILRLNAPAQARNAKALTPLILRTVTAAETGQVFSVAIGKDRSVYLGATSAFGLSITKPGSNGAPGPRLKRGEPSAKWMDGQFGPGAGPGAIWKIDAETGKVSLFTSIEDNSGPGVGGLTVDPVSGNLYASDLDSGLVYRFDETGKAVQLFDHGVDGLEAIGAPKVVDDGRLADIHSPSFNAEDPNTWGFTARERQVTALAIYKQRLYYAVAAPLSVWSVSLGQDGSFGSDFRKEVEVKSQFGSPITSLSFDSDGVMYAAQRGPLAPRFDFTRVARTGEAQVLKFRQDASQSWQAPVDSYAVGRDAEYNFSVGGVDVGCAATEVADAKSICESFVWSTIDGVQPAGAGAAQDVLMQHGLQGVDKSLPRPRNVPPAEATYAVYDQAPPFEIEGYLGDLKIVHGGESVVIAAAVEQPAPAEPVLLPHASVRTPKRIAAVDIEDEPGKPKRRRRHHHPWPPSIDLPPDADEYLEGDEDWDDVELVSEPEPVFQIAPSYYDPDVYGPDYEFAYYAPVPVSSCGCPFGQVGYLPFCHAPLFPIVSAYQTIQFVKWTNIQVFQKKTIINIINTKNAAVLGKLNRQNQILNSLKTKVAGLTDAGARQRVLKEIAIREKLTKALGTKQSTLDSRKTALNAKIDRVALHPGKGAFTLGAVKTGTPSQGLSSGLRSRLDAIRDRQRLGGGAKPLVTGPSGVGKAGFTSKPPLALAERRTQFNLLKQQHLDRLKNLSSQPASKTISTGNQENTKKTLPFIRPKNTAAKDFSRQDKKTGSDRFQNLHRPTPAPPSNKNNFRRDNIAGKDSSQQGYKTGASRFQNLRKTKPPVTSNQDNRARQFRYTPERSYRRSNSYGPQYSRPSSTPRSFYSPGRSIGGRSSGSPTRFLGGGGRSFGGGGRSFGGGGRSFGGGGGFRRR